MEACHVDSGACLHRCLFGCILASGAILVAPSDMKKDPTEAIFFERKVKLLASGRLLGGSSHLVSGFSHRG